MPKTLKKSLKKAAHKLPWMLNKKYTVFFMWSHIFGWTIAWAQTVWLIIEIRKARCQLPKNMKKK
jgi:hypothetical protein